MEKGCWSHLGKWEEKWRKEGKNEKAGGWLCLNIWMKNCNELGLKIVTAVLHSEIEAVDFPSFDVYSQIRRKLLVIWTPASYFDGIAVPDKGIGLLFFHLKAVSLGMQRLFHFLEYHSFFLLLVYHNHSLQLFHFTMKCSQDQRQLKMHY